MIVEGETSFTNCSVSTVFGNCIAFSTLHYGAVMCSKTRSHSGNNVFYVFMQLALALIMSTVWELE
jgi:Ca2+/Na+ antiporter